MKNTGHRFDEIMDILNKQTDQPASPAYQRLQQILTEAGLTDQDPYDRDSVHNRLLSACGKDLLTSGVATTEAEVASTIARVELDAGGATEVPDGAAAAAVELIYSELAEYGPTTAGSAQIHPGTGAVDFSATFVATQQELDHAAALVAEHNEMAAHADYSIQANQQAMATELETQARAEAEPEVPLSVGPTLSQRLGAAAAAVARGARQPGSDLDLNR